MVYHKYLSEFDETVLVGKAKDTLIAAKGELDTAISDFKVFYKANAEDPAKKQLQAIALVCGGAPEGQAWDAEGITPGMTWKQFLAATEGTLRKAQKTELIFQIKHLDELQVGQTNSISQSKSFRC